MSLSNAQVRATVAVSDITKAAEFYEATLGLSPHPGEGIDNVRIYSCGEGSLLQVYASEHAGTATATVASWSASDFESVVDELSAEACSSRAMRNQRPTTTASIPLASTRSCGSGTRMATRWRSTTEALPPTRPRCWVDAPETRHLDVP